MKTLSEIRQQYPQYSDMSDSQLADALHTKFYSDIPKDEYYSRIGINAVSQSMPNTPTVRERAGAAVSGAIRGGVAGLAGLPVDTVENAINLGLAAFGSAATAIGKPDAAPELLKGSIGGSEHIAGLLERSGVRTTNPRPDDPLSRMLFTGGLIAGSAGRRPIAPSVAGAVAGETLGPEWVGVAAMTPAAVSQAGAGAKAAISGASTAHQSKAQQALDTFKQAGATPTVGQATQISFIQGLENLAAKFPGGAGVMRRFIEGQQEAFGVKARTGVSGEDAGRAIEKGVIGQGGFLERTKQTWQQLDAELASKVKPDRAVFPTNTAKALDELTKPVAGAEETSAVLRSSKVADISEGFFNDLAKSPTMPYQAIRELRSRVGELLDDTMVTGIPGGELKKLYGALTADMQAAAKQAGASQEFARQNNYYRARMERVETVLERVIGKAKQPEDVFKAFMPSDPDQANKVRAVMRSLDPSQRKVVSEAVVNRLGRAAPGKQDEFGEVFSSETFLTNYNKLSDGAKAQLFPNHSTRQSVDAIAKAAANIREGSSLYSNPSGTAGSFAAYAIYTAPLTALGAVIGGASGGASVLASALASAGTANVGAKMLTNPKVVEWLARPINPSKPGEAVAHLARLGVIYNQTNDEKLRGELERFISSAQQSGQSEARQ